MRPPSVVIKRSRSGGRSGALRGCGAGERAMNAVSVVIVLELPQLPGQVHSIPE